MNKYASALAALLLALAAVVAPTHAQRPADSAADVAQAVADGRASATELLVQFRSGVSADDRQNARGWVNAQRKELLRGRGTAELELAVIPPGLPPGSDVGNNRALLDLERGQHAIGIFLPNSFRTSEPIGALSGHDGRRLALDLRLLSRSNEHQGQQKRGEK
jgi:hypothetical protein